VYAAPVTPYYADDLVTLYLGDCREVTGWLAADVLVTDPPYGKAWAQHGTAVRRGWRDDSHDGIANDGDTSVRDEVLAAWGQKAALVFGDFLLAPPGAKQALVYDKGMSAGFMGGLGGFRRNAEAIYLTGCGWPTGLGGRSSILANSATGGNLARYYGHPHAKPVGVMETLIAACPPGTIADPFTGSGSTLVAARNLGRHAIGVEVDERYAEAAARRLSQDVLALEIGGG
jgi:site-specific DNA-methyltransferase (adenine-specific)